MQATTVFEHQMSFRVFDTQFGVQSMENICEILYCLVPFLTQRGPYFVLFLIAFNRVVMFFSGIYEGIPCGGNHKYYRFLCGPLLRVSILPVLNMGDDLEELKSNIFPIEKIVDRKIPFKQIQPFIYNIRIYQSFK